ncbi:SUN domain-containing protein 2-like [Pocillopora damicornis]|nr:SUN domain-containing protein 2-like [Pocillopora damicornis]
MTARQKSRSDRSFNLLSLDDTPKRRSTRSRILTSTPSAVDKRVSEVIEKQSGSTRVVKRSSTSQQKDTLFSDDEVDHSEPLVHSDKNHNIANNTSTFDDRPEHLYGLDNSTKILSGGKDESESVQAKPRSKHLMKCLVVVIACLCFIFLMALMGLLSDHLKQKQHHGDDTAEIKLLKNRIRKLEQVQSRQSIKTNREHAYQKVLLKGQSKTWEGEPVENKIEEALRRWDADKIGIPDYALESAGGQIHGSNHSPTFANGAIPQVLLFGIPVWYEVKLPRVIIQPGSTPGECWAFHGSSGFVVIKLSRLIKPTSFTLEHMATTLSQFEDHSIPSAPKEFSVWGWADARGSEKVLLGEYLYSDRGHALQNFPVQATTVPEFRYIELKVLSNYGNPAFTCLYRFRVHGLPYKTYN